MPKAHFQKRITMRTVGTTPDQLQEIALAHPGETPVVRIVGTVESAETGKTQIGEYSRFSGDFLAINLIDGEEYRSKYAVFPGPAELLVSKMLESAKKADRAASATFGLDITVKEHKSSYNSGYRFTYGIISLSEAPAEDGLSLLAKQFGAIPLLVLEDKTGKKRK